MKYRELLKITSIIVIFLMSISPAAAWVSISVTNSTMNFGTVVADGTPVYTSSTISISGNENLDFYVRANGPLTDAAGDIISNNPNFQFRVQHAQKSIDSGYVTLTNYNQKVVNNWPKPNTGGADAATETYLLTVPPYTPVGNYTTTVIFTVISNGVTPTDESMQVNDSANSSLNNINNSSSTINGLDTIENTVNITYSLLTLFEHYF